MIGGEQCERWHEDADRRLRVGGKSDWPLLAAALAFECPVWSDDIDFFGTGVAVWSTANVMMIKAD